MELLCPSCLVVHHAELHQHSTLILAYLLVGELLATIHLRKDLLNLQLGVILGVELLNAVVAQAATHALEVAVTHLQSINKCGE